MLVGAVLAHGTGPFSLSGVCDEVRHGKPDPEPYLRAAGLLGVYPAACVVLEDSPAAVVSGLAAGCAVVAVPSVAGVVVPAAGRLRTVSSLAEVDTAVLASFAGAPGAAAVVSARGARRPAP